MKERQSMWSFAHVLAAGVLALALMAGLSLLFSHLEVRAKPPQHSTVTDTVAASTVLTPTSQTRSPEKGALIEREGLVTIEGVAWLGNNRPPFPGDPVLSTIQNYGEPNYYVTWSEAVSGTHYVLYEADNPYFENSFQYPGTAETSLFISGQAEGTYYYRVKAYNAEGAGPSRWSNVESVTVGSGTASTVSASGQLVAGEPITVWVQIDAGAWHTATVTETDIDGWDGWDWSYDWTLPEEERYTKHAIHTRASVEGTLGPTDTITVTVNNRAYYVYLPIIAKRWPPVPLAPAIQEIGKDENTVQIRWSYSGRVGIPDPSSYTVWEDTNRDFSTPTEHPAGSSTSLEIDKHQEGTFYYKVRGNNSYGPGEWSNIVSINVRLRPYAPTLQAIDNTDGDDSYVVRWSYGYTYPSVDTFILKESTNSDMSGAETYLLGGSTMSRKFTNKGSDT
ncbi:MAG: fibronectin type III domain-containing protein, partial [Anaerolineae bacterium]|nr:fibronectin type III domain-containing protein [Anaerolineae bacterium]